MNTSKTFFYNPPSTVSAIHQFERERGLPLPDDYKQLLLKANGGEGFLSPKQYAILYQLEELIKFNNAYQAQEYAPGLLIVGSNGGGEALAFDQRRKEQPVVRVPFIGMSLDLVEVMAHKLTQLIDDTVSWLPISETAVNQRAGKEIIEIQPIIMGGSPTDPSNKVFATRQQHIEAVRYWNGMIHGLRQEKR